MPDPAERRYVEILDHLIEISGHSRHFVEKELGWGKGHLTRVLQQRHELKVRHVLSILAVLKVQPAVFFSLAHPPPGDLEALLGRVLQELKAKAPTYAPLTIPAAIPDKDLDQRIQEAVERALANLEKPR